MNSFFGVDPAAIECVRDLGDLFHIVSPSNGRFIFDWPNKWCTDVRRRLADLPEIDQARVDEWFRWGPVQATFQPLPGRQDYNKDASWETNARRIPTAPYPLRLMGKKSAKDPVRFIHDVFSDPEGLPPSGSAYVALKATAIAEALAPLLMVSTKVVLVDPYLRVATPTMGGGWVASSAGPPVLKEILRTAGRGRVEVFEVFASNKDKGGLADDPDGKQATRHLEDIRDSLPLKHRIDVKVRSLESQANDGFLDDHDRHVLGNHCGISSGRGFSQDATRKTKLQWLGGRGLTDLLEQFM